MLGARLGSVVAVVWLALAAPAGHAQAPPASPPQAFFNDYAGLVSRAEADRLDARLLASARATGAQIVVAVYPRLPYAPLEEFTRRTANAWRVGHEQGDRGVVLFVFVQDRRLRIEVSQGLRAQVPDPLAQRILDELVTPRFRANHHAAGLEAAIGALVTAVSEREPAAVVPARAPVSLASPRPVPRAGGEESMGLAWLLLVAVLVVFVVIVVVAGGQDGGSGTTLGPGHHGSSGLLNRPGGGGFSGGGSSFSGGGFRGGGASGGW